MWDAEHSSEWQKRDYRREVPLEEKQVTMKARRIRRLWTVHLHTGTGCERTLAEAMRKAGGSVTG